MGSWVALAMLFFALKDGRGVGGGGGHWLTAAPPINLSLIELPIVPIAQL